MFNDGMEENEDTIFKLSMQNLNLTKRESECFYLLSRSLSIKNIAKKLNISPRTVEVYVSNLKKKVKVYSKAELSEIANEILFNEIKKAP